MAKIQSRKMTPETMRRLKYLKPGNDIETNGNIDESRIPVPLEEYEDYIYPGPRPFNDTATDRHLFFGRKKETETMLHKVLTSNITVLYAKSGVGKTSLINAGLKPALRERGYLPLGIRFSNHQIEPVKTVIDNVRSAAEESGVDVEPGEEGSLWQFFKSLSLWSADDELLKPVVVLDQFEEFFHFHENKPREEFTRQLADVVFNNIPADVQEEIKKGKHMPYIDRAPDVKFVIVIREDELGLLEEMAREIPAILHHRLRLLPLTREQAHEAVTEPLKADVPFLRSRSIKFSQEAIDTMMDFLCRQKKRGQEIISDEVEPMQLQLLCSFIEKNAREKEEKNIVVNKEDLGAERGLRKILKQYYREQIKMLGSRSVQRKARNLIEMGLITYNNRRLSLDVEEIKKNYNVCQHVLDKLVDARILRAEPRVGSVYYELIHDNLVLALFNIQKKRLLKIIIPVVFVMVLILWVSIGFISSIIKAERYVQTGRMLRSEEKYEEAIKQFDKAIDKRPGFAQAYNEKGIALLYLGKYDQALKAYETAISLDENFAGAYYNKGSLLKMQGKYREAMIAFDKAVELGPHFKVEFMRERTTVFYNLGTECDKKGDRQQAAENYKKALDLDPNHINAAANLAEILMLDDNFDQASFQADELLSKIFEDKISNIVAMRFIQVSSLFFREKDKEAADELKRFMLFYRSLPMDYKNDWDYTKLRRSIEKNQRLTTDQKELLLRYVDLLAAPADTRKEKLEAIESFIKAKF